MKNAEWSQHYESTDTTQHNQVIDNAKMLKKPHHHHFISLPLQHSYYQQKAILIEYHLKIP
jgi:protein-arginine kinase